MLYRLFSEILFKMNRPTEFLVLEVLLLHLSLGSSVGNSYSSYSQARDKEYAYFETQSQNFRITRGEDIIFPCHVKNIGKNVITWKTGSRLLTAGPIKVYNENRLIHNKNGTDITMMSVQPQDSGEYSCQVNLMEQPLTLTHTLDVLVPPEVSPRTPEVTVKAGGRTEVECIAKGNPKPHIHWRRLDGRPIQGETKGDKLIVENITKDSGGVFVCVAQNGVSTNQEEVTAEIDLQVLYPPEVRVRHRHHHPRLGQKTLELTCEVFADPHPDVNWYRGRSVLSGHSPHENKYNMKSDSGLHTHSLIITDISEEDYGNYSCHAANSLGEDKATLIVSGKPLKPIIISETDSNDKNSYQLKWRVESAFPVTSHNVHYKRKTSDSKNLLRLNCNTYDECVLINVATVESKDRRRMHIGINKMNVKEEADFTLRDLLPDTQYLVQIQTVNEYGRSHWSDIFQFNTFGKKVNIAPWSPFHSTSCCLSSHIPSVAGLLVLVYSLQR